MEGGGVFLAICGGDVPSDFPNPYPRLYFSIYKANVRKYPPAYLVHKMNAINQLSNPGAYPWEVVVGCIVRLSKFISDQYQEPVNTYKANIREYSPGDFRCHGDKRNQLLT